MKNRITAGWLSAFGIGSGGGGGGARPKSNYEKL